MDQGPSRRKLLPARTPQGLVALQLPFGISPASKVIDIRRVANPEPIQKASCPGDCNEDQHSNSLFRPDFPGPQLFDGER